MYKLIKCIVMHDIHVTISLVILAIEMGRLTMEPLCKHYTVTFVNNKLDNSIWYPTLDTLNPFVLLFKFVG